MLGSARSRFARFTLKNALILGAAVAVLVAAPALASGGGHEGGGGEGGGGEHGNSRGAVYTATNDPAGNAVVAFSRGENGSLTYLQTAPTQGLGTASQPPFGFPIVDASDSIRMSQDKRHLFVVNSGDDTVTSFRVGSNGRLTFADKESSGGDLPISLAINEEGDVLYVLNELSGNVHGFHVSHSGNLTDIAGSTQPTDPTGPGGIAADVGFIHDDAVLMVTLRAGGSGGQGSMNTFRMRHDVPGPARAFDSPAPNPFGFTNQGEENVIITHAGPITDNPPNPFNLDNFTGSVSSFETSHSGGLDQNDLQLSHGRAACWVVVTDNQRYAYITNTLSSNDGGPTNGVGTGHGAVTSFRVTGNGSLRYIASTDTSYGFPSDEALSTDSRYLYALVPAVFPPGIFPFPLASTIDAFRVGSNGSLTRVGTFTSPDVLAALGASGIGAY